MYRSGKYTSVKRRLYSWVSHITYDIRHSQMVKILAAILFIAFIAAIFVTFLETHLKSGATPQITNLGRGLYWALVTMTTVGYGDIVPKTTAGMVLATVVMFSGMALVSVFTATVASRVITKRLNEGKGLSKVRMRNHIVIVGWNVSAESIITAIRDQDIRTNRNIVLVNQMKPELMEAIIHKYQELRIKFVFGDPTDEVVLSRASVDQADSVIIIPDESYPGGNRSDERIILATLSIKAIDPKIKVIAHIQDPANAAHLRRANADKVVLSDQYSGFLLGANATSPGIPELLDVLISGSQGVRLARRKIPNLLVGKTFGELNEHFQNEDASILIGIVKEEMGFKLDDILSDDFSAIDIFIRNKLETVGKGLGKKTRMQVELNPPRNFEIADKDIAIVIEHF